MWPFPLPFRFALKKIRKRKKTCRIIAVKLQRLWFPKFPQKCFWTFLFEKVQQLKTYVAKCQTCESSRSAHIPKTATSASFPTILEIFWPTSPTTIYPPGIHAPEAITTRQQRCRKQPGGFQSRMLPNKPGVGFPGARASHTASSTSDPSPGTKTFLL